MTPFGLIIVVLVGLKWATQLVLERLNERNVCAHSAAVPNALKGVIDPPTYSRTVAYTLAKAKLRKIELTYGTVILLVILFSGVLPAALELFHRRFGSSPWAMGCFLF